MLEARISSLPRKLDLKPRIKWSVAQEDSLNRDYPFTDLDHETPEQFVARTYLQFLWLPESIMPLQLLVPSLQRVQVASTSAETILSPHPLHALLDPILLTARAAANKFQVELPRILNNDGGDGEVEEAMMWYALGHEKGSEGSSELFTRTDEKWRTKWIKRMERREVQIQILLHLLILALPGPRPLPPEPESPEISSVKRRKLRRKKAVRIPTPEERLEAFMDKLSMFQLMGDLQGSNEVGRATIKAKDELNWTQFFCQDVVEPLFKSTLPSFTELLRSKVFPNTLFSDDEEEQDESNAVSTRHSSPALSDASTSRDIKRAPSHDPSHQRPLQRERSRSLSISLAEEAEEKQKSKHAGSDTAKRRVLTREVSMSFKTKSKAPSTASSFPMSDTRRGETEPKLTKRELSGTVLVEATPVKVRTVLMSHSQGAQRSQSQTTLFPRTASMLPRLGEEEEDWEPPGFGSPDIMLTPGSDERSQEAEEEGPSTPTKKRKRF